MVEFKTHIEKNAVRKEAKYKAPSCRLRNQYSEVKFANLSIGSIGTFCKSSNSLLGMMSNLGMEDKDHIL